MKHILFIASIILFFSRAEATVFRLDTKLPKELQIRISKKISENCIPALSGLTEESTTLRYEQLDQGQVDTYYYTRITGHYYFDGAHPSTVTIFVNSAEYDISNPAIDRYELLRFQSDSSEACN